MVEYTNIFIVAVETLFTKKNSRRPVLRLMRIKFDTKGDLMTQKNTFEIKS